SQTSSSVAKVPPSPKTAAPAPAKPTTNAKAPASASKASVTAPAAAAAGRGTTKPAAAGPAGQPAQKRDQGTPGVESRPDGATIFLDGKRIGTTPLTLDVKVGQYTIGLDIPGYQRWASTVKINSGERSRLSASLER